MSTVIRLSIVGKTHQHTYRVVAQDKRSKRDGKFLEILGNINPFLAAPKQIVIKKDRVAYWQKNGAQVSPTVAFILKNGKLPPRPKKQRAAKDKQQAAPQAPAVEKPQEQVIQEASQEDNKAQDGQADSPQAASPAKEEPKQDETAKSPDQAQTATQAEKTD